MKLTTILLLVALLQLKAEGFSQQITLQVKNGSLDKVFAQLGKQSGYHFFFNERLIKDARKVSLNLQNATLQEALDACFTGQPFNYAIIDKTVVARKKTDPGPTPRAAAAPVVITIKGRITSEKGEPLPGASVKLKNSTKGATSDAKGEFSFTIPDGTEVVLEVSMLGYKLQTITPSDPANVVIVLKEEATTLDNLVVIGYGTARRQDFTGSVSSVKMEGSPLASLPNMNALEVLKGNVSGLSIGATNSAGGQPSMVIRGQNSISGNNDPMIILDGVVFLGSIGDINPNDIASFDILKDATSAAAYGSRSANGVIAITTKKGRIGKPSISFNTSTGFQTWQNEPEMMRGEEWLEVVNARNRYAPGSTNWLKAGELANRAAGKETVWLDEVTRTGIIQSYQAAVSGATQQTNYYLSTSFDQNKGIIKGDDFKRVSLLAKLNMNITSWLEVGADGSYTKRDYSGVAANIGEAQMMSPYGVMYRDSLGNLEKYPYTQAAINPLWGVQDGTRDNMDIGNNFRLNAHALVKVPWIDGLSYRANLALNLDKDRSGNFYYETNFVQEGEGIGRYSPSTVQGFLSRANGNINNYSNYSYVIDNILNYRKTFGKHSVDATAVYTRDYFKYESENSTGSDFQANGNTALGMYGLQTATVQRATVDIWERANIGYLIRGNYNYNNRYFLTGSFRRDGASVFGANNKWADFAAVGVAWRITEEAFMKNLHYLNHLKLKFSWGQNGNQGIGPYGTLSTVGNGASGGVRYQFSNTGSQMFYGLFQRDLGNSDLGWETTESWNAGFESSWFNERLFVDLDMYKGKTTDQLFTRNIPVMTGFKTMRTSMGQVDNKGVEITVRSVNVKHSDWGWTTAATFWLNRNKLVKLYGEDRDGDGKEDDDVSSGLFIGQPLYAIYGYEQIGIVQESDTTYTRLTGAAPGSPMYRDFDKTPGISATDRKILGYAQDNFRLSMSNTVNYKEFDLYVMVSGNFGGNGYYKRSNAAAYLTSGTSRFNDNMTSKPYWTPENKSNTYPSAFFSGDGRFLGLQSRTFVRLQDVTLSYRLKQSLLTPLRLNSAKFFVSAKNLATFTNWFGGDPETGTPVRENTFPVPSTYSFGANISF
ncbi:TonB-dependent receptor [Chitinophaga horti]|uniref:TonB-dependent receptor n=1 Tax=Chitinophaga horti TaxID=2920382 RepID=A0ABY6J749_9BACT|nr:TonB-dependent receptor [Chitinophaga horti]UYQ94121.1 TonB-dependent receptor [Chitinophaga horti]